MPLNLPQTVCPTAPTLLPAWTSPALSRPSLASAVSAAEGVCARPLAAMPACRTCTASCTQAAVVSTRQAKQSVPHAPHADSRCTAPVCRSTCQRWQRRPPPLSCYSLRSLQTLTSSFCSASACPPATAAAVSAQPCLLACRLSMAPTRVPRQQSLLCTSTWHSPRVVVSHARPRFSHLSHRRQLRGRASQRQLLLPEPVRGRRRQGGAVLPEDVRPLLHRVSCGTTHSRQPALARSGWHGLWIRRRAAEAPP